MISSSEKVAEQIFKIVKGFNHPVVLFTDSGKKTVDTSEARRFYLPDIKMMINFEDKPSSGSDRIIVNLSKGTDISKIKAMLNLLRDLSTQYIIDYSVKTFGKEIKPKDFSFMAKKKVEEARVDEISDELKRRYLDKAVDDHYKGFTGRKKMSKDKLGKRRAAMQKASLSVTGKKHFGDLDDGKPHNAGKWWKGKRYSDHSIDEATSEITFSDNHKGKISEAREMTYKQIMKKINDGEWETSYDIKPGRHVELRNTSNNKKFTVYVKESQRVDPMSEGFSGWQGSARKSVNKLNNTKIIIRHSSPVNEKYEENPIPLSHRKNYKNVYYRILHNGIDRGKTDSYEEALRFAKEYRKRMRQEGYDDKHVEIVAYAADPELERQPGRRTKKIESIYIENGDGERFKLESKSIAAAKAMARHIDEGGNPYDDFGQYIYEVVDEMAQLRKFQRKNRRKNFFEDAKITEEIDCRVSELREMLSKMANLRPYKKYFENFSRDNTKLRKEQLDELKNSIAIKSFDEDVAQSLPYVAKLIENLRGRQEREAKIIELAKYVMDNKDRIEFNSKVSVADPENPDNLELRDPATRFAAWVDYIAPKIKDDDLANKLMRAADVIHDVGPQHVKIALTALRVILQKNNNMSESLQESKWFKKNKDSVINEALEKITKSLDQFDDINSLFGE